MSRENLLVLNAVVSKNPKPAPCSNGEDLFKQPVTGHSIKGARRDIAKNPLSHRPDGIGTYPCRCGCFLGMFGALARRVRWQRLLRSCDLDPDQVQLPLKEPGNRDFIICGIPRSGTSLVSALLFQPPTSVVCMEPWDGLRLEPAELFASIRGEIEQTGMLSRGRLDVGALATGSVRWHRDGERVHEFNIEPGYQLGVKWPGFWRYLDLLPNTRFLVCVRRPEEAVRSFEQTGGRLAKGLEYDVAFHRRMNQELTRTTDQERLRRVLLYQYVAERIVRHVDRPQVLLVHFERWEAEPKKMLAEISTFLEVGLPDQLQVPIRIPEPGADAGDTELIRRYCPSAIDLGYKV